MSELQIIDKKTTEFLSLLNTNMNTFINSFGSEENAKKFLSAVRICIQNNPALLDCTQDSLRAAIMECVSVGLLPSNWRGDCWIIPYESKGKKYAQFQLGYKGIKELCFRSGIEYVTMELIFENDEYSYEKGLNPILVHKPKLTGRGKPIAAYSTASFGGKKIFEIMSEEEVMGIKNTSKAKDSAFSPWNSKNDPQKWMWKKTVFKQLSKLLPTSEKLQRAIYLDNVAERGGYFDEDGSIVEQSFTSSTVEESTPKKLEDKFVESQSKNIVASYIERISKCSNVENLDLILEEVGKEKFSDQEVAILKDAITEKRKLF